MINAVGNAEAILRHKPQQIHTIAPERTVYEAIEMMAEKNIGALPVVAEGKIVGIVSERDYTRKVVLKGKSSKQTPVRDIMNSPVIPVAPSNSVEDCLRLMSDRRIRHLPVMDGEQLIGIISIGDLVNWVISAQAETINQLQSYISGQYHA